MYLFPPSGNNIVKQFNRVIIPFVLGTLLGIIFEWIIAAWLVSIRTFERVHTLGPYHLLCELIGVFLSCISILKLSVGVYNHFCILTDYPLPYFLFFSGVFFMIMHILAQGKYL